MKDFGALLQANWRDACVAGTLALLILEYYKPSGRKASGRVLAARQHMADRICEPGWDYGPNSADFSADRQGETEYL